MEQERQGSACSKSFGMTQAFSLLPLLTIPRGCGIADFEITCVSPAAIPELIQRSGVCQVLLAFISSLTRRRELASELGGLGLRVLTIPSLAAVASGRHRVSELKALSIDDLLGREISEPLPGLLQKAVTGKSVLITGAGGSIGSELCRQALKLGAQKLVLVERSEFALYAIHQELASSNAPTELMPVLGDASDQSNLEHCCRQHSVEVLVHAAAISMCPWSKPTFVLRWLTTLPQLKPH